MEQMEQSAGNTKSAASDSKKSRSWAMTINNPVQTPEQMEHIFYSWGCVAWIFQLEQGACKTPHYQGCIQFKNPRVWPKKDFPEAHWEPCRSWSKSVIYCQKLEGRLGGPWAHNVAITPILKVISNLYPWQERVVGLLKEPPNDRRILWLWEKDGGVGKTQLAKLICATNPNAIYVGSGKSADVKYALATMLQNNKYPEVVIFGMPRSYVSINLSVLEEVKDGIFFSSKYESGMTLFNSPHVLVLANIPPEDYNGLTRDKWDVHEITEWMMEGASPPPLAGVPPAQG